MPTLSPDQWRALAPYLDEALGMSEEERTPWLASLRRQDAALAEQLESLLREHEALSSEGFLEQGFVGLPAGSALAGLRLGPYTLRTQIGQGGMGNIWLAERSDDRFERQVAVKFLNLAFLG